MREYLVAQGVPANRIRAQGAGESRPVADNNSPEGRANNRRVEIIVASGQGTSTTERQPSTIDTPYPAERKPSPAGGAPTDVK